MSETQELVHVSEAAEKALFMPSMSVDQAVSRYQDFTQYVKRILRDGTDFGTIPGTSKPTLYKPGAEKLCSFFGLRPHFVEVKSVEQWDKVGQDGLFYYWYKTKLEKNGYVVGEGEGSCNSHEVKYRWRWVPEDEIPPSLDKSRLPSKSGSISEFAFAIDKAETTGKYGKPEEYWGRWRAAIKEGKARKIKRKTSKGEADAWEMGDAVYRVPNPDIADQINTIQKMAQKRALIAAVLIAVGASEFFTQDLEDFAERFTPTPIDAEFVDQPAEKPTTNEKPPFDYGQMVEHFQKLRGELAELGGKQAATDNYYNTLGAYGCKHANEFQSKKEAMEAYRDLLGIKKQWERNPPAKDDDLGLSEDDL